MAKKPGTKKKGLRDSAVIIDNNTEQFCLVSSQTVLSSNNVMEVKHTLDDSEMGSLQRAGFFLSLNETSKIERKNQFNGISLLARETRKEFNYEFTNAEEYDISGLTHPAPSVASFTGGYTSRDGCFIIGCNDKSKRVVYLAGILERGCSRLKVFGFPTTVAKPLQNACTAYPELFPDVNVQIYGDNDVLEEYSMFGQTNTSTTSYLRASMPSEIFNELDISDGIYAVVRVELPTVPNGTCSMKCIGKIK